MSTVSAVQAEAPYILALDIGTSSVRASLFDLLELVWQCIDAIMVKGRSLINQIVGVASCTFVGNILGVDRTGRAVIPLATYADTRANRKVATLRGESDELAVHTFKSLNFPQPK